MQYIMKKIAILLALALALSCCLLMLAACGDSEEASSPADSSAATSSAATSSEKEASSAATSSEKEESSAPEESSEPEESSAPELNPDATENPDHENLALGKPYTKSQLYQQGGADVNWAWSDDAPVAYPDTDDAELTDGLLPAEDASYSAEEWIGFHQNCPDYIAAGYAQFTVDLEEIYLLSELSVYVATGFNAEAGVGVPATVEFWVSEDGENFTLVGSPAIVDDPSVSCIPLTLECNVTGQYVQVRLTRGGWIFVSEFEAY